MQNKLTSKTPQNNVKTGIDVKPPVQNTSNFPQNVGKYGPENRPEQGGN